MSQISLKIDSRQHHVLTPKLQYAVRLLQLSSLDYEQELHDVVERNPFLELEEPAGRFCDKFHDGAEVSAIADFHPKPDPEDADVSDYAGEDAHYRAAGDSEPAWGANDSWLQIPGGARDGARESHASALDLVADKIELRPSLRAQANLLPLSNRDHALLCAIIESLDDDGYLRQDLSEIADMAGMDPVAERCEMNTALKLLQSFEPSGVGARTVEECLLLQLDNLATATSQSALCRRIVERHLDSLAQRGSAGLACLLGEPAAAVDAACALIRRLDPRPGLRFGNSDVHFIKPDVVVRKTRGRWMVSLNRAVVPRLRFNQVYAQMFEKHGAPGDSELGTHLKLAHWTLNNIDQRFATILAVAAAVVRRQHSFFEHGPLAMKPLALRDIAEELGVHESTVSRVTNNKYMDTPGGLVELKKFFSRPMPMSGGGACSATAIRGLVREIIASENPLTPLSDVEITQRLNRQGMTVARRTVSKYRQMLKILPVDQRRHAEVALA